MDTYISTLKAFGFRRKSGDPVSTQPTVHNELDSDAYLISRLWLGDKDAISELFKLHSRAIFQIGMKLLRDSGEAEDLVQEVFLYVFRRSELFDPSKGPGRSWLFQIAYTQALLRKRKLKSIGLYSSPSRENASNIEASAEQIPSYESTPEGLFGRNGWRKIVEELTEDQRETLRLHFFEGYTFAEIAEKLGQSHANVRNHHYRGLEKLRKHLAADASNRR